MIWNVIDNRLRRHRWKRVNAAIEPTAHDNSCRDADRVRLDLDALDFEEREGLSVAEAVSWASAKSYGVTLYLYDATSSRKKKRPASGETEHFKYTAERFPDG